MIRRLVFIAMLAFLAACGSGPDAEALQHDIEARLAKALPGENVTLEALHRRGSQKDVKAPEGERRRVVYFDANLRVSKDYDLGAWDSPGIAGLISALGTGPKGLEGVITGGNKAGDVIRAHGTAIYRDDGDRWVAVAPEGFMDVVAPSFATGAPRPAPEVLLNAMSEVINNAPPETSAVTREVIAQELQNAHTAIQARIARVSQGYVVAAGPSGGQYLRFAQALDPATRIVSLVTAGGEHNLHLVREGRASLGLVQGDSALLAYQATGPYANEAPYSELRALGTLYPEPVHVLVRADSDITTLAQLAGKRVAIGVPGSASRTTALAILEAHGLPLDRLGQAVDLALNGALVALRQQEIDALIQVIGFPADSIRAAMSTVPLRLLSLDDHIVATLGADNPAYFGLVLPAGTYPQQAEPVSTVATAAVMIVSNALTDAEVEQFTRRLYARGEDLVARGSSQGAQVSAANARRGLAIPIHETAAKVLRELQSAAVPPKP